MDHKMTEAGSKWHINHRVFSMTKVTVDESERVTDVFNVQMIAVTLFANFFIFGQILISNYPEPFRIPTDLDTTR